jgi:hypothetical protein
LTVLLLTAPAVGAGPETSLRPVARAVAPTAETPLRLAQATEAVSEAEIAQSRGPMRSLRPEERPARFARMARDRERLRQRGAVCGDPDLQGEEIGPVAGSRQGCGSEAAVRVHMVSDVELSQRSVMDCETAKALKTWVEGSAKPALSGVGGGLKRLRVAAHYICRTRNNQPGGRISEHGRARAIDISGFRLRDGSLIMVQNGWKGRQTGKILREMHRGACGPFGTVLGPEADRHHHDHFHFDTARHRSGPYCR